MVIGWLFVGALSVVYALYFGAYIMAWVMDHDWVSNNSLIALTSTSLLLFLTFIAISIFVVWLTNKRNWDPKGYFRFFLILVFIVMLIPFVKDIPPIENDYTWADLPTPEKQTKESFGLLLDY